MSCIRHVQSLTVCTAILFAGACAGEAGGPRDAGAAEPEQGGDASGGELNPMAEALVRDVGFDLLRLLAAGGDERVMLSPHGVASALLLAWNGAAGETREAIDAVLEGAGGADPDRVNAAWAALDSALLAADPTLELTIANSLWSRAGTELLPDFVERSGQAFRARLTSLDFAAADASAAINGWVGEATGGKIDSIVPDPIPPRVVLYILNALYFKGEWTQRFDPADTQERPFYPDGAESRDVPMMERSGSWRHMARDGLEAVRLPYGAGRLAMYVVAPAPGGLDGWLADLDAAAWQVLLDELSESDGRVVLPKFSFGFGASLVPALRELGMGIAFGEAADFSAMTTRQVAISDVLHKTFIEVDEKGSEAAAATSIEVSDVAFGLEPFEFEADRPFFFAVQDDETGAMLFVGVVRALP